MCIRDRVRKCHGVLAVGVIPGICLIGVVSAILFPPPESFISVSYTHLDVYKRQQCPLPARPDGCSGDGCRPVRRGFPGPRRCLLYTSVAGDRAVLGPFLHVPSSLIVVAEFHDCCLLYTSGNVACAHEDDAHGWKLALTACAGQC